MYSTAQAAISSLSGSARGGASAAASSAAKTSRGRVSFPDSMLETIFSSSARAASKLSGRSVLADLDMVERPARERAVLSGNGKIAHEERTVKWSPRATPGGGALSSGKREARRGKPLVPPGKKV